MNAKTTITLAILMFLGLGAYWWTQFAHVPTAAERRARSFLVLPELADLPADQIARIEIDGGDAPIVLERAGKTRWSVIAPVKGVADSKRVETLLGYLITLRKSFDAGSLEGDPAKYGLDKPERTVRLFRDKDKTPAAALDVGKVFETGRYVRPVGQTNVEVVDARALDLLNAKTIDWREQQMFTISPLDVAAVRLQGPDRDFAARREESKWRIVKPIQIPADENKIVALVSDLIALRVMDPPKGFVADDVKDEKKYGFDHPRLRIELETVSGERESIAVGAKVPNQPDRAYARRGDQTEVVAINASALDTLGLRPIDYRSPKIADFDKGHADLIDIQAEGVAHRLSKNAEGTWEIVQPAPGRTDQNTLKILLDRLEALETNDILKKDAVRDPGFDKPLAVFKVWERPSNSAEKKTDRGEPSFELILGRHDAPKKSVYARLAGDPDTILPLPDNVLELVPRGRFAFRNRAMTRAVSPNAITQIVVRRGASAETLKSPATPGDFDHWRLTSPVDAPADVAAIPILVKFLSDPHAFSVVAETLDDPKKFGLDQPALTIEWSARLNDLGNPGSTLDRVLKLGATLPDSGGARYAVVSDSKPVFVFSNEVVRFLESEWRDRVVMRFVADQVKRVELAWPNVKKIAFDRDGLDGVGRPKWKVETDANLKGFDFDRLNSIVSTISATVATRYIRHDGDIPAEFGLDPAKLTIRVTLDPAKPPLVLRIGLPGPEPNTRTATNVDGNSGPVFLLPDVKWAEWIVPPGLPNLPANPFGEKK